MATALRLIGYDRASEFLAEQYDVPPGQAVAAKRAAGVAPAEGELMADWPLSDSKAREIASLINARINLKRCEYFLESYAVATGTTHHPKAARAA